MKTVFFLSAVRQLLNSLSHLYFVAQNQFRLEGHLVCRSSGPSDHVSKAHVDLVAQSLPVKLKYLKGQISMASG